MTIQTYEHRLKAGANGAPLFIVFHGTGGDENQFFGLAEQLLPEATIVSPRGDVSEYGAARFFRRTGEGVYDMEDLARATDKMAGFIAGLVAQYKPSEVIGLGYSNGANIMANLLRWMKPWSRHIARRPPVLQRWISRGSVPTARPRGQRMETQQMPARR